MIEGIAKLRDFAVANLCGKPGLALLDIADEIEREIEANYMELPKDADGVPIHMSDSVEGELLDNSTVSGIVCAFHLYDDEPDSVYIKVNVQGGWTIKELHLTRCHHVKPRTIEDVLNEYYDQRGWDEADNCAMEAETLTAKYADEIRELLEVRDD